MRAKTMSQRLVIFTCLMIAEIRAQCDRPSIGGNRVLTAETDKPLYDSGSIAKFKCSVGYEPANRAASNVITCEGHTWTDLQLECKKKSCGSLNEIPNGRYEYPQGIQFGATAVAICNTGYRVVGYNKRNCRDAGWDGRDPICEVVKCERPPEIDNGSVDQTEKDEYDYGEAVTYSCMDDFTLFGKKTISCSHTGSFDPSPPKCLKVSCEEPNIPNGYRIEGKSPPYGYKSFVRYMCEKGYVMNGSDYMTCDENRWDPSPPECILLPPPTVRPSPRPTGTTPGGSHYRSTQHHHVTNDLDTLWVQSIDYTSPSPPVTPTPYPFGKALGIGIGVGVGIGAIVLAVWYFMKRRPGMDSLKVPTSNEDAGV